MRYSLEAMRDFIIRIWFPGWVGLVIGCGSSERNACYAQADAWMVDRAYACALAEGTWSECSKHDAIVEEHKRRQAACP